MASLDDKIRTPLEPESIDFEEFVNYCSISSYFKNDAFYKIYKYNPVKPLSKLVSHLVFNDGLDNEPILSMNVNFKDKVVKVSLSGQKKGGLVSYACLFTKDNQTKNWSINSNSTDSIFLNKSDKDKFVGILTYLNSYLNHLPLPVKKED